jgi:hypothetical protein
MRAGTKASRWTVSIASRIGTLVTSVVRSWPSTIFTRCSAKSKLIGQPRLRRGGAVPVILLALGWRALRFAPVRHQTKPPVNRLRPQGPHDGPAGMVDLLEASPGIEPGCKDLQSSA